MIIPARPSIAIRSAHGLIQEARDNARVVEGDGVLVVVLANGFEFGFSCYWAPAARLVLDAFEQAWNASDGTPRARLSTAFGIARARFETEAVDTFGLRPEDLDGGGPGCTLLAVAIAGDEMHATWIGGDHAFVTRARAVIHATTPHTLRETFAAQPDIAPAMLEELPDICSRIIASPAQDERPPSTASFVLRDDDVLVLLGHTSVSDAVLAGITYPGDAANVAEHLADVAFEGAPFGYVVALRFRGAPSN